MKTIKPATSVGGIAGGTKYVKNGVLYKFCVDVHGFYGGDEFAAKVGGHELKGLMAYQQCRDRVPAIHLPLVALIDYRGYRLAAITKLPINASTLVYGSADGGDTIVNSNPKVDKWMKEAASLLKIKEHRVGADSKTGITKLAAPCDIEGHIGTDGRFYLLDFARVYPPSATIDSTCAHSDDEL